jgi:hypothetical protein
MLTFDDCKIILGKRSKKKLRLNTTLSQKDDNTYVVCFYNTDIVEIRDDGTYTLNHGGWMTVTTKARINEYSPGYISQKNGVWYLNSLPFKNGCCINLTGELVA